MSVYFHLRAVPPSALRNSASWFRRLFDDDWDTVRDRIGRHREEVLDRGYLHHELLYAGVPPYRAQEGPCTHVVLGGRPIGHPDPSRPPFLLLTAAQAGRVAEYLEDTDFADLWERAREEVMRPYGMPELERDVRGAFAAAHRDLRAFYTQTAHYGDAVVKWLMGSDSRLTRERDAPVG
ncbi:MULTISPECIES: DUF1877 family protein [unclassified Streptomyces]|uniref:DUF1877 family protein n=1 Tax=unclassified Streptomyces TaxID=2593676 RepID=UPI0007F4E17A|nr:MULTISPECIES: DUF1877 family protein [unclassified Streptomyces]MCM1972616.1 YfbM family protein [Streptomyces sp. G1]SBT91957.1 protein of unknown function [Streptomyces sp. DI166]